jgi:hypothetical protein
VLDFVNEREVTEGTEKIHNEATGETKGERRGGGGCAPATMMTPTHSHRLFSVRLRSLRFFVVNLLRSLRDLQVSEVTEGP